MKENKTNQTQNKWETEHIFNESLTRVVKVRTALCTRIIAPCTCVIITMRAKDEGESSARAAVLTTAFAHSCCMIVVLAFHRSFDSAQWHGVGKEAGGWRSVIMTCAEKKTPTLDFRFTAVLKQLYSHFNLIYVYTLAYIKYQMNLIIKHLITLNELSEKITLVSWSKVLHTAKSYLSYL